MKKYSNQIVIKKRLSVEVLANKLSVINLVLLDTTQLIYSVVIVVIETL